ncbi:hypothetical protein [Corallibacter sp.]|uniref:hypothetical protein n=1 Tax=Corallibacter sp. TaxID=2038084 RepID=UPI003A8E0CFF
MTLIFYKIFDFLKSKWQYVLVFILPIILYFLFSSSDEDSVEQTENEINYNHFHSWFIDWANDQNVFWERTPREIFNDAKLVAIYLGTYKHHTQNSEDEVRAVEIILKCKYSEFQALEYAYNRYFTDNKDLTADLHSYLSSSQYDDIAHILF